MTGKNKQQKLKTFELVDSGDSESQRCHQKTEVCRFSSSFLSLACLLTGSMHASSIYHKNSINFQRPKKLAEQARKEKRCASVVCVTMRCACECFRFNANDAACGVRPSQTRNTCKFIHFVGANTPALLTRESPAPIA